MGKKKTEQRLKTNTTLLAPDNLLLPKTRKYDEACLSFGFTMNVVGDEKIFLCVLCLKPLAVDRMKPNKLSSKRALEDKFINELAAKFTDKHFMMKSL